MEKLKTDYRNGDPILASMWNSTNEAVNRLMEGGNVITMQQREWDALLADASAYLEFCRTHEGYILNVTENYANDNEAFAFGGVFPIVFS